MPDEIDSEQTNSFTEETPGSLLENSLNEEIKAEKEKKAKRPKPTLEGINAPVSGSEAPTVKAPNLTVQEKRLISETEGPMVASVPGTKPTAAAEKPAAEPRLLPKSVVDRVNNQNRGGVGKIIGVIILLLLGFASYQLYQVWGLNDTNSQDPQPNYQVQEPVDDPATTTVVILPENSTGTDPSITPTPPVAAEKKLKINSTPTGWLNFRSGPGLSYSIITKVNPGEIYSYSESQSGWYKITLTDGRSGWVIDDYVTLQ